jgi:2-polyprenyl-3-methyl-5-hydroxy-6-metoxy-1,4-benzoquinol methylase
MSQPSKAPTKPAGLIAEARARVSSIWETRFRALSHRGKRTTTHGFFDSYPRFLSTSETAAGRDRLNQRYHALIECNASLISGQSVLDLASHDGRWSFAAHKAGARHVLGIEVRDHLIAAARANMREYGVAPTEVEFRQGDLSVELDLLSPGQFPTIFCFGFLYHTIDHMEILRKISRLHPKSLIIDTWISSRPGNIIEVHDEEILHESSAAVGEIGTPTRAVKGYLTRGTLELMLKAAGFPNFSYYDWRNSGVPDWTELKAYYIGRRVTLTAMAAKSCVN